MIKFFSLFLLCLFVFTGISLSHRVHAHTASTLASHATSLTTMQQSINGEIAAFPSADISVSLINLSGGQTYHYGTEAVFEAASTSKLITAAAFLRAVEQGTENLDEDPGGQSAGDALQAMIVQSDNGAWQLLDSELGEAALEDYASQIGINDFNYADNTLTSNDIALLLDNLYSGQLLNKTDTNLLLGYMKQANYTEYIRAAVPANITVYHKAGLLDDRLHDAAIITNGRQSYVLVVFTKSHDEYSADQMGAAIRAITSDSLKHFIGQSN